MTDEQLALLLNKMDALNTQVNALAAQMSALTAEVEELRRAQILVEDLVADGWPVMNQAVKAVTQHVADLEGADGDSLLELGKRVLTNTERLHRAFDLLEAGTDLLDEVQSVSQPAMRTLNNLVAEYERKGYFIFAQEGMRMIDRIVTEFTPEDARALADNIVLILRTVKNMTQPDIMALANRAADTLHAPEPPASEASLWALLRDMNDPKTRLGLARLLRVLQSLGQQPAAN